MGQPLTKERFARCLEWLNVDLIQLVTNQDRKLVGKASEVYAWEIRRLFEEGKPESAWTLFAAALDCREGFQVHTDDHGHIISGVPTG